MVELLLSAALIVLFVGGGFMLRSALARMRTFAAVPAGSDVALLPAWQRIAIYLLGTAVTVWLIIFLKINPIAAVPPLIAHAISTLAVALFCRSTFARLQRRTAVMAVFITTLAISAVTLIAAWMFHVFVVDVTHAVTTGGPLGILLLPTFLLGVLIALPSLITLQCGLATMAVASAASLQSRVVALNAPYIPPPDVKYPFRPATPQQSDAHPLP